jgi:Rrf2 family protein
MAPGLRESGKYLTKKYDFPKLKLKLIPRALEARMKVTAQEEYGLRCMMQMASSGLDKPLTVQEIAGQEGLSSAYVSKLMTMLRDAGLVDSIRGRSGGYYLARPPSTITISEILAPLGGRMFEDHYCDRYPGDEDECVHLGDCAIRSLWGTLAGLVDQVLARTTLSDLLKTEECITADLRDRQRRRLPLAPQVSGEIPSLLNIEKESDE